MRVVRAITGAALAGQSLNSRLRGNDATLQAAGEWAEVAGHFRLFAFLRFGFLGGARGGRRV